MIHCNLWIRRAIGLAALSIVATAGCGPGGPIRYEVSGTVTYDGKPVPKGFITILPDDSQGNDGPGGGAPIENGVYRTAKGKGITGGPHLVRIIGTDGIPYSMEGEEIPEGKSLFPAYETTIDFPKQATEQNFDIPKAALAPE